MDYRNGKLVPFSIDEVKNLGKRRAEVGLMPTREYLELAVRMQMGESTPDYAKESREEQDERMAWWRRARFGM